MAYNKEKIFEQAKEAIVNNNLFFIEDIIAWLPCDKTTFYRFFEVESNEYNTLKDLLEQNKIKTKSEIRTKLFKSNKAAELLALYRLICTKEEHMLLNQQYIEQNHTSSDGSMTPNVNISPIEWTKTTDAKDK